jgi:Sulfotransferase family
MLTPLIISGMHRSGTSLLANVFHSAGVNLGERLLGPGKTNAKGHFEDIELIALHDDILKSNGTNWTLRRMPHQLQIDRQFEDRARGLLDNRSHLELWGWKDPRTVLFLDFWENLLPNACFVFVFRRADEVVDSLRRRNDRKLRHGGRFVRHLERVGLRFFSYQDALRAWSYYNTAILRFVTKKAQKVYLLDLEQLERRLPPLLDALRHRAFGLSSIDYPSVFESKLLTKTVHDRVNRICNNCKEVAETYEALKAAADMTLA